MNCQPQALIRIENLIKIYGNNPRMATMLGLKNLNYNLKRYVFWQKQDMAEATT